MRDLQFYGKFAMEILDSLNIPYGKVVSLTVNTRARRWGQCSRNLDGTYEININQTLLDERNAESGLMNTLLHEFLHTCPDCMNHGPTWKKYAEIVRKNWGYDVKRTSSQEEKGVVTGNQNAHTRKSNPYLFEIRCPRCGLVEKRKTRKGAESTIEKYQCAICLSNLYIREIAGLEYAANGHRL